MIPLAIWLLLIGYTITWTGRQNLGISYQPQSDGSIKPVGVDGKPARTYSLVDAITCAAPSGAVSGAAGTTAPPVGGPTPTPQLNPVPVPNPTPVQNPQGVRIPGGIVIPGVTPRPVPSPSPTLPKLPGINIPGLVYGALNPIVHGLQLQLGSFKL